jgi:NADH-quinone oxidoreductase subunit L
MFHLFTHAFFKALLFLGAGSVIEGMHHEQDMRKMGALWKRLPVTYAVMMIGTLAITGVGIPGLDLGFSGFYSKDTIINAAFVAGRTSGVAAFAFVAGLLAAGLTSFYSWRLIFMTFHGHAKWGAAGEAHASPAQIETHDEPLPGHDGHGIVPRESPWTMLGPLLVLALGAIIAGAAFVELFVGSERAGFWRGVIFNIGGRSVLGDLGHLPAWVVWGPLGVTALGLFAAWYAYIRHEGMGARIAARRGPIWLFLYNKWYFDELYQAVFVKGAKALGDLFWKVGDEGVIDRLGPNGVSAASYLVGKAAGRLQSGYVYHYAFVMLLGVAGLLSYALWAFG